MKKDQKAPKRGGARRGPYSGKKMTFTTKLTEPTMARLTAAAKASEMSVSQKGEAAILRGLDAEDDFHRHFTPALGAFERQMVASMPVRGSDDADFSSWRASANEMVETLAEQLKRAILGVAEHATPDTPGKVVVPSQTAEVEPASPGRKGRILDLD